MKRTIVYLTLGLAGIAVYGWTAFGGPQGNPTLYGIVNLQDATPGTKQTGHANISGTMIAGQFAGGGASLTGVNADKLDGLDSTAFLQSIPVPLTLSGSSTTHIIKGTNSSTAANSVGVQGVSSAGSGATYGVIGQTSSSAGRGVLGQATATAGDARGVYGTSASTSGLGVVGWASATSGATVGTYGESNSPAGYGIYGIATSSSGTNYGVFGTTNSSINGWGVYAIGRLGASGTKAFRIDHPLDPANKYLMHYAAEGPEPKNIYDGTARTDAQGRAWVRLPDYFEKINKEPRYQLTVVDDSAGPGFVQVKIARKIRDNRFLIMTSAPYVEVNWEVKATRDDLWMQRYGAPVEVEKSEAEKGRYQHPELYGLPADRGLGWNGGTDPGRR